MQQSHDCSNCQYVVRAFLQRSANKFGGLIFSCWTFLEPDQNAGFCRNQDCKNALLSRVAPCRRATRWRTTTSPISRGLLGTLISILASITTKLTYIEGSFSASELFQLGLPGSSSAWSCRVGNQISHLIAARKIWATMSRKAAGQTSPNTIWWYMGRITLQDIRPSLFLSISTYLYNLNGSSFELTVSSCLQRYFASAWS